MYILAEHHGWLCEFIRDKNGFMVKKKSSSRIMWQNY